MMFLQFLLTAWTDNPGTDLSTDYTPIPEELIPVYKQDLHYQRGGKA